MDQNNKLSADNEHEDNDFVSLFTLITRDSISISLLATAIEVEGIYGWDIYGRFLKSKLSDEKNNEVETECLGWLASVEKLKYLASYPDDDAASDLRYFLDGYDDSPSGNYGWPYKSLPDFSSLQEEWDKDHLKEGDVPKEQPKNEREKHALKKILAGLVVRAFTSHPEIISQLDKGKTSATTMIQDVLKKEGYKVSTDSIQKYLKNLPAKDEKQP